MNKENICIVLWIIFGFVFITAIDSILYFIIHLIYFGLAELKISYKIMTYIFPILTFIFYSLTAILILKKINQNSDSYGFKTQGFPKIWLIILTIVILILNPLTNKLSGLYGEFISSNNSIEIGEYLNFYGWFNFGFTISKILVLIGIVTYSLLKLKTIKLKK